MAFQIQVGHQIHWMTLVLLKSRENVFLWAFFGYVYISHTCSEGKQAATEWCLDLHKIEMFWSAEGAQFMEGRGGVMGLVVGCGGWGAFNRAIHSQVYIYLTRGRLDHIFDGSQQISFEQPKSFSGSFCILAIFLTQHLLVQEFGKYLPLYDLVI